MHKKLVQGINRFQSENFRELQVLFEELLLGQTPDTLFITCSDSRVDPNLLTRSKPGELFIVRNAGNIVPPHGVAVGGEAATIEYAVTALGVKDIIICGHSHCGAMYALHHPETLGSLPKLASWISHADATRSIVQDNYKDLDEDGLLTATIEENVLVQLKNLRTHPVVASRLVKGDLELHAWVYTFESGEVSAFDTSKGQFVPLDQCQGSYDGSSRRRVVP